jgi:hypothetical protein
MVLAVGAISQMVTAQSPATSQPAGAGVRQLFNADEQQALKALADSYKNAAVPLRPTSQKETSPAAPKAQQVARHLAAIQGQAAKWEAESAVAGGNEDAAIRLAVLWFAYGTDSEQGIRWMMKVRDPLFAGFKSALEETNPAKATFLLAEALYGLAKKKDAAFPIDEVTRRRLLIRADFHYNGVAESGGLDAKQQAVAEARLKELDKLASADVPQPEEKVISFFGIKTAGDSSGRIVFLVQSSGAMIAVMDSVKADVKRAVTTLDSRQQFQVIFFADKSPDELKIKGQGGLHDATADNKQAAFDRLTTQAAASKSGRPDPTDAFRRAMALKPDTIYVLGVGDYPNSLVDYLRQANKDKKVRVHAINYCRREGEAMLKALAAQSGGSYKFVTEEDASKPPADGK